MNYGMLWFDNEPTDLAQKVRRASEYYKKQYQEQPNMCQVHTTMLDKECIMAGIHIIPVQYIRPHHLWIGKEKK